MNNNKNDFVVRFPIEHVADWVKREGVEDGYILYHQNVHIENIDRTNEHVVIDGYLTTRQDS